MDIDTINVTAKGQNGQKATRPPIIVMMGHIDHGKSMILETVRKTKMLEKEAGGITQHIGAYEIDHHGKKITFIDTPGHEAFSKMRSRGAKVADIAVLVVAADEGVKPQTKEAIEIIRSHNLPFVVALNKVDKPEANPERVKQELTAEEVLVESYGGKVPSVEVSAKTGQNLEDLLETILLLAELEGFTADPGKQAEGVVIEAHLDPRRGITATLLLQDGTLHRGDVFLVGRSHETVKIFEDFRGVSIAEAGPSAPVRVAGLSTMPAVGEMFRAFPSKAEAKSYRASHPEVADTVPTELSPDRSGLNSVREAERPIFNIILKTDVAGSQEALEEVISQLPTEYVGVKILKSETGEINESDIKLAQATKLVTIIGFKVRVDPKVAELAKSANIRIITGDVIYELLDQLKKKMVELIPPEIKRTDLGKVKILKLFKKDGARQIVGGRVEEGVVRKLARLDIKRLRELAGNGNLLELQREKMPIGEASKGEECGMLIESKTAIQEGDVLEMYQEEIVKRTL